MFQFLLVLSVHLAVDEAVSAQADGDQNAGKHTGYKLMADTEVFATLEYTMKGIDGGMMTPSPPATATRAAENVRSYPTLVRNGMHMDPTRSRCRRSGTGDCPVEQAGNDDRAGMPAVLLPTK